MNFPADPDMRLSVLITAAEITTSPSDADAVTRTAGTLLAWIEAAPSAEDAARRLRALKHHGRNCWTVTRDERTWMDDPVAFLDGAKVLYDFATAEGQELP